MVSIRHQVSTNEHIGRAAGDHTPGETLVNTADIFFSQRAYVDIGPRSASVRASADWKLHHQTVSPMHNATRALSEDARAELGAKIRGSLTRLRAAPEMRRGDDQGQARRRLSRGQQVQSALL